MNRIVMLIAVYAGCARRQPEGCFTVSTRNLICDSEVQFDVLVEKYFGIGR